MAIEIYKKNKDIKNIENIVGKLENNVELVKEQDVDYKINSYIRNGIGDGRHYSLSQELCLHRKKILGTIEEKEWQDYIDFVVECIEKAREEDDNINDNN